jgi:hypothetical protein
MPACRIEVEVLQVVLLVGDDQVHVAATAKAVLGDREERVGVRRQVDAHHAAAQRDHRVDQARALMAEPVVIVAPAGRGEQHVE